MKKIQLTNAHKEKLFQIPLFRDLPLNIKESLLDKLDFVIYAADKKEIVVTQGTPCNKLYVLLEGKLRTDIIDGLGNEVMIENVKKEDRKYVIKEAEIVVSNYIKRIEDNLSDRKIDRLKKSYKKTKKLNVFLAMTTIISILLAICI